MTNSTSQRTISPLGKRVVIVLLLLILLWLLFAIASELGVFPSKSQKPVTTPEVTSVGKLSTAKPTASNGLVVVPEPAQRPRGDALTRKTGGQTHSQRVSAAARIKQEFAQHESMKKLEQTFPESSQEEGSIISYNGVYVDERLETGRGSYREKSDAVSERF